MGISFSLSGVSTQRVFCSWRTFIYKDSMECRLLIEDYSCITNLLLIRDCFLASCNKVNV